MYCAKKVEYRARQRVLGYEYVSRDVLEVPACKIAEGYESVNVVAVSVRCEYRLNVARLSARSEQKIYQRRACVYNEGLAARLNDGRGAIAVSRGHAVARPLVYSSAQ